MKQMIDLLREWGIDLPLIMAGFSGGFATLIKNKALSWSQKTTVLGAGGLSANYVTPLLADFINLSQNSYLGLAFFVGFGGLKLVEKMFEKIEEKINKKENETN
jgi:hypothetical protein